MLLATVDDDRRFAGRGGEVHRPGDRPDVDVSCGDGGQEMAEGEFPCQVHIVGMPHRVAPRPAPISMTVYRFSSLAISRSQCAPIQSLFGHLFGLRFTTIHGRGK